MLPLSLSPFHSTSRPTRGASAHGAKVRQLGGADCQVWTPLQVPLDAKLGGPVHRRSIGRPARASSNRPPLAARQPPAPLADASCRSAAPPCRPPWQRLH